MFADWTPAHWSAVAAWVTVGVVALSLFFVWQQVREAVRLRESQSRPFVVVDLQAESGLIHLTIENTGTIAARGVRLEFDPPVRTTPDDPWPPEGSTLLSKGIPTLPPGKKLRFFLDSFPTRFEKGLPLTYEAKVTYTAESWKKPTRETYTLDLSFLVGLGQIEQKGLHEAVKEIEKIRKRVDQWTEHLNGLRVYVIDQDTYDRESRIAMAWDGVQQKHAGGQVEDIRQALREALVQAGEPGEPPDAWVEAIANEKKNIWIRLRDLDPRA